MSFLIKNDDHEENQLLKKFNEIWYKINNTMQKGFDDELVFSGKYLKTERKFYDDKINTDFHVKGVPKEGSRCVCV